MQTPMIPQSPKRAALKHRGSPNQKKGKKRRKRKKKVKEKRRNRRNSRNGRKLN